MMVRYLRSGHFEDEVEDSWWGEVELARQAKQFAPHSSCPC